MYRNFSLDETIQTMSFDVFDTLITRPWFHPFDQFAAIAPQLRQLGLCSMSDSEWMTLRIDSDREARARASSEEVSLSDIYSVIAERLHWNTHQAVQAYDLEVQRELEDIRPIAHALERVKQVQATGKNVIVTSDTYFSAAQLALLLQRCGYDLRPDRIFASADHGLTKITGRLFSAIMRERKFHPHQFHHIGDQPIPDGRAPANLGIRSTISAAYLPARYERLFAQSGENDFLAYSAVAGCARVSRLARTFNDKHQQTIWNVGCDVAGPLLLAYVLWVLSTARDQGIDRIYFLARDGEILLEIARHVCQWLQWSVDCRYLYASRRSYALPAITEFDENANDWILDWWQIPSIRSILTDLSDGRLVRADWDRALTQQDLQRLHIILKDLGLSEQILSLARDHREVLIDYLLQEGLADGTKWALCDVGWRGSIQRCLAQITATRSEFPEHFKGFYLGLNRRNLYVPVELTETFYTGDAGFVSKFGWLVEAFCWAEHGGVEHFSRNASGIAEPVLAAPQDWDQIEWGSGIQRAAIMHFVDNFTRTLSPDAVSVDQFVEGFRQKAMAAFEMMRTRPSLEEAEAYGSIEIDYDIAHKRKLTAGPALRPDRLLLWLALRHRSGVARFWWPEGAIRRSVRSSALRVFFHAVNSTRLLWDRLRGRIAS